VPADYLFEKELRITASLEEVFAFFSKAENLGTITPAFVGFAILSPVPIEMRIGTIIDNRIRVFGIPLRWKSKITAWDPPLHFADEQLKGPYRKWLHDHTFHVEGEYVVMNDRVQYQVPGGIIAPLIHFLIVRPQIRAIFGHRNRVIGSLFSADPSQK
jgi:ligand-binding SRPBCC domain-containing protein